MLKKKCRYRKKRNECAMYTTGHKMGWVRNLKNTICRQVCPAVPNFARKLSAGEFFCFH